MRLFAFARKISHEHKYLKIYVDGAAVCDRLLCNLTKGDTKMEKVKKGDMLYIVRNVGRDEMKIVTSAGPKWFSVEGIIEKFSQDRMTTGWARAYLSLIHI